MRPRLHNSRLHLMSRSILSLFMPFIFEIKLFQVMFMGMTGMTLRDYQVQPNMGLRMIQRVPPI